MEQSDQQREDVMGSSGTGSPSVAPGIGGILPTPATLAPLVLVLLCWMVPLAGCRTVERPLAFPARPIKVIVPFAAGGSTDTLTRVIKKAIDDHRLLPHPFVILNIEGAGGSIGSRRVKNAPANGYTLLSLDEALLTSRSAGTTVYGPEAFEPVAATGNTGLVLVVGSNSRYGSLPDVMAGARHAPLIFGANLGAVVHFAGLMLEQTTPGVRFRFAQTGGGAKRFSALIGGHLDVTAFTVDEYLRFRDAGIRALAYLGERRHPAMPDLATAREQGYDVVFSSTNYWWAPKGTSQQTISALADALGKAMTTAYVRHKMADLQIEPVSLRGKELRERLEATERRIAAVSLRPSLELPSLPVIVTSLVVLFLLLAVRQDLTADRPRRQPPSPARRANRQLALFSIGLTFLYAGVMGLGGLSFRPATILFVLTTGAIIAPRPRSQFIGLLALAGVLALGLHAVFSRLLAVDLP